MARVTHLSRTVRGLIVLAALLAFAAPASAASYTFSGAGDLYDAAFDVDALANNFRVHLVYGDAGGLFEDTTSYVVNDDTGNVQSSVNNLLGGTLSNTNLGTNNDGGGILTRAGENIGDYTAIWHIDASGSGYVVAGLGLNGGLVGLFGTATSRDVVWEVSTDNATWTTWLRDGDIATVGTQAAINDATAAVLGADEFYVRLTGSQVDGLWWNTQAGRASPSPGTAMDIQVTFELAAAPVPAPAALPAGLAMLATVGLRRRR